MNERRIVMDVVYPRIFRHYISASGLNGVTELLRCIGSFKAKWCRGSAIAHRITEYGHED